MKEVSVRGNERLGRVSGGRVPRRKRHRGVGYPNVRFRSVQASSRGSLARRKSCNTTWQRAGVGHPRIDSRFSYSAPPLSPPGGFRRLLFSLFGSFAVRPVRSLASFAHALTRSGALPTAARPRPREDPRRRSEPLARLGDGRHARDGDRSSAHRVAGVHARRDVGARSSLVVGALATCTSRRGRSAAGGSCRSTRSR